MTTFFDKILKQTQAPPGTQAYSKPKSKRFYFNRDGTATPNSLFQLELSNGDHVAFHPREELVDFKEPNQFGAPPFWMRKTKETLLTIEKLNKLKRENPMIFENTDDVILNEIQVRETIEDSTMNQAKILADKLLQNNKF
jgi:hypothetical protein